MLTGAAMHYYLMNKQPVISPDLQRMNKHEEYQQSLNIPFNGRLFSKKTYGIKGEGPLSLPVKMLAW